MTLKKKNIKHQTVRYFCDNDWKGLLVLNLKQDFYWILLCNIKILFGNKKAKMKHGIENHFLLPAQFKLQYKHLKDSYSPTEQCLNLAVNIKRQT